mgnify:CR=1 FL=1
MQARVQQEPFDLGTEAARFAGAQKDMGAVVTFTGIVRDAARGGMVATISRTEVAAAKSSGAPSRPRRLARIRTWAGASSPEI